MLLVPLDGRFQDCHAYKGILGQHLTGMRHCHTVSHAGMCHLLPFAHRLVKAGWQRVELFHLEDQLLQRFLFCLGFQLREEQRLGVILQDIMRFLPQKALDGTAALFVQELLHLTDGHRHRFLNGHRRKNVVDL